MTTALQSVLLVLAAAAALAIVSPEFRAVLPGTGVALVLLVVSFCVWYLRVERR